MKKIIIALLAVSLLLCSTALASAKYDLDNFGYRTVKTRGQGNLVFQSSPRGSFMREYSYRDGDRIFVNLDWREDGYAIAYADGDYGYVDARYIDWGSDRDGGRDSDDERDLSNFEYRTVRIKGRGSLVFQKAPRGSFMYDYRYWDGDRIYVNVDYRKNGYALAYEDGVYGYVDASYIDWGDDDDDDDDDTDRWDLDDFEYRTVKTRGRGSLVFQKSPRGAFMNDHKFRNGDEIYVNVYWREDGYALAYEDGEYGYVDASYIDW